MNLDDTRPRGFVNPSDDHACALVIEVARRSVAAWLEGADFIPPEPRGPLPEAEGIFVTLRGPGDALRGCIGYIGRSERPLLHSVAEYAVSSASRDPRFDPVVREEFAGLRVEVSLLGPLEPVQDMATLDARRFGVVCTAGRRRGVLLPDIDGVDTVAQQLEIACSKAGINPRTPYTVHRFQVFKVAEAATMPDPA